MDIIHSLLIPLGTFLLPKSTILIDIVIVNVGWALPTISFVFLTGEQCSPFIKPRRDAWATILLFIVGEVGAAGPGFPP
ncbi:MAG: hypothetical protein ACLPPL_08650, partial [Desulfobaccales bacterium]